MTNAEFYANEIKQFKGFEDKSFCIDFINPKVLGKRCDGINCIHCNAIVALWLMEEHKESKVDWKNVPIDTPILVRDNDDAYWEKRYFAEFVNGKIYAWDMGATSFSNIHGKVSWKYAKLWEGSEEQAAEQEAQCTD